MEFSEIFYNKNNKEFGYYLINKIELNHKQIQFDIFERGVIIKREIFNKLAENVIHILKIILI